MMPNVYYVRFEAVQRCSILSPLIGISRVEHLSDTVASTHSSTYTTVAIERNSVFLCGIGNMSDAHQQHLLKSSGVVVASTRFVALLAVGLLFY